MCKFVDASANSKVKILDVFRLNAKDKADVNKFSSCSCTDHISETTLQDFVIMFSLRLSVRTQPTVLN